MISERHAYQVGIPQLSQTMKPPENLYGCRRLLKLCKKELTTLKHNHHSSVVILCVFAFAWGNSMATCKAKLSISCDHWVMKHECSGFTILQKDILHKGKGWGLAIMSEVFYHNVIISTIWDSMFRLQHEVV